MSPSQAVCLPVCHNLVYPKACLFHPPALPACFGWHKPGPGSSQEDQCLPNFRSGADTLYSTFATWKAAQGTGAKIIWFFFQPISCWSLYHEYQLIGICLFWIVLLTRWKTKVIRARNVFNVDSYVEFCAMAVQTAVLYLCMLQLFLYCLLLHYSHFSKNFLNFFFLCFTPDIKYSPFPHCNIWSCLFPQ